MRLIDADALIKTLETTSIFPTPAWLRAVIIDAPTIEPQRKKGHWIWHPEQRNIFNGKTIECSECHEKYTVQYVEDELFCRHCGADMRGEQE